jgi:hypothetical protein
MSPTDFFANNLPRDQFGLWRIKSTNFASVLPHVQLNNMAILNQNFDQRKVLREHSAKLLNWKNGATRIVLTNLMAIISRKDFAGLLLHHMPAAFLKQTFRDVWAAEPEILNATSAHKFRDKNDVSQYLIRAWQMVSGNFEPRNISAHGEHFTYIKNDFSPVVRAILLRRFRGRKLEMFCISDEKIKNFRRAKREINSALNEILPQKSTFEINNSRSKFVEFAVRPNVEYLMENSAPQVATR